MSPMNVFISHNSAAEYWLSPHAVAGVKSPWLRMLPSTVVSSETLDFGQLAQYGIMTKPVHLLVSESGHRGRQHDVCFHVLSGPVPKGAFVQLDSELRISSPELCFCQMAASAELVESILMGCDFCSQYCRTDEDPRGFVSRQPLTSCNAIERFCARFEGKGGVKNARKASQYIIEGTVSPFQTALALLLTLPRRYGGYGMPECIMNGPITLMSRNEGKLATRTYYGEFMWPEKKVIVEYDEYGDAISEEAREARFLRYEALNADGWTVLPVTWEQLNDAAQMDAIAEKLARLLQVRKRDVPRDMLKNREIIRQKALPDRKPAGSVLMEP